MRSNITPNRTRGGLQDSGHSAERYDSSSYSNNHRGEYNLQS